MSIDPFDPAAVGNAGFAAFARPSQSTAISPDGPAWKSEFRATLDEIHEKGFRGYADDLHKQKIEELRAKILEKMGLSEEDLDEMSPEGRAALEQMISEEIRQRLAAATEMENKGGAASERTGKPTEGELSAELQGAPNGLGAGTTLLRAMEQSAEPEAEIGQ